MRFCRGHRGQNGKPSNHAGCSPFGVGDSPHAAPPRTSAHLSKIERDCLPSGTFTPMRPKGEIHLALLKAVGELATPERGASLREVAARACVGIAAARHTMHYLHRSGAVVIARTRRVEYRNRPVSEYALPAPE
eukprot:gene32564-55060_t